VSAFAGWLPPALAAIVAGMLGSLALVAMAILAILGTDRLGRPLTAEEKAAFSKLLREHDYVGARLVALRFAWKLARKRERAKDLMGRANLRLVRRGWDPAEVSLVRRLCRLVWSEWTNTLSESDAARKAEERFVREMEVTEGLSVKSIEEQAAARATRLQEEAVAKAHVDKLRERLTKAGDEVNMLWLAFAIENEVDLGDVKEMARRSGRDVTEFYRAADRRKRLMRRIIAENNGVDDYDEDD
jgi:hypothetical protein